MALVNESRGSDIGSSQEATGGLFCSISDCGGGIYSVTRAKDSVTNREQHPGSR